MLYNKCPKFDEFSTLLDAKKTTNISTSEHTFICFALMKSIYNLV